MEKLNIKKFKNEFVSTFAGDQSENNYPRQTPNVLYSKTKPSPVAAPRLLAWSDDLAKELEIEKPSTEDEINILSGNLITESMESYAACYGGHQFGNWAGQLGDGRAITLGEWETTKNQSWELQLKGAGQTPYSRRADGRAVLRSSVREYLMSEAMHYLGVPTTRALSLVTTGEKVLRDMFYNGNPGYEPGAIVMRTAPGFIRFGNFEILASRNEIENLKKLTNWTIDKFYPHLKTEESKNNTNKSPKGAPVSINWFKEIVEKTAFLITEWERVGFVHGVMNTDNMSILGLTIDYGPFSFLDDYNLSFTPNTTDIPGRRYAFGRQASVAFWNLGCLADAIAPLLDNLEQLKEALSGFKEIYQSKHYSMTANKLGFDRIKTGDKDFINNFERTLADLKPDMTIFYQLLADIDINPENEQDFIRHFADSFYNAPDHEQTIVLNKVMKAYIERIRTNTTSRVESLKLMNENNPRFILRNYLLHQAIEELEKGDDKLFFKLMEAIKYPYSNKFDEFFVKRPDWAARKAGCSMLSCSS